MCKELTPCPKCGCMTKSIRVGRANYKCGKCGADKSLSDVYFYETVQKKRDMFRENKERKQNETRRH